MNKNINIMFLIMSLFLITFVSANGLMITNQTTSSISKIVDVNTTIGFTIYNSESFSFYNITFENDNIIAMNKIPVLASGQSAVVTANVRTNTDFTGSLRLKGFYTAVVGVSNTTYNVNVNYASGLSLCNIAIIKGDKVKWINQVADEVVLRNVDTSTDVTTILQGNSYITNFDTPTVFRYSFLRRGFPFTDVCTITALNDNGLVSNPLYDGFMNLTVRVNFNPTNLSYNIIQRNYTIIPFQTSDGVITIQNIGTQVARSVTLSGEWATFNANGFDLNPQQSKSVIYTYRPQVSSASETNKTYIKKIIITGNFATIEENFNIFVPYYNVNSSYNQSNYDSLLGIIQAYCISNPTISFCQTAPPVVYIGNGTNSDFNVTMNQEQVKKIFEYMFQQGDDATVFNNFVKEKMDSLDTKMNSTNVQTQQALEKINLLEEERKSSSNTTTFTVIFIIVIAISSLLVALIWIFKKYNLKKEVEVW